MYCKICSCALIREVSITDTSEIDCFEMAPLLCNCTLRYSSTMNVRACLPHNWDTSGKLIYGTGPGRAAGQGLAASEGVPGRPACPADHHSLGLLEDQDSRSQHSSSYHSIDDKCS